MIRSIFFFLLLFPTTLIFGNNQIIVSIAPTKYLVERITSSSIPVKILVPNGASPHSYEPTCRQILDASKSIIWFRIGEGFETPALKVMPKEMDIVDLRQNLDLIPMACQTACCHTYLDPHIWLSTKLLKKQSITIFNTLSKHFPEKAPLFQANLTTLLTELDTLDSDIKTLFLKPHPHFVLVAHPSFGYFCHDYNLEQLSIEADGKEPTPLYLSNLLTKAREEHLDRVFISPQYDKKGGIRLAQELNAKLISLDPYEENVIANLKKIALEMSQ